MNVKMIGRYSLAVAGCLFALPVFAQTAADEWATPLRDPLRTLSRLSDQPVQLPGDAESFQLECHDRLSAATSLSLIEVVDLALCHNPQVKNAWSGIKVQAAGLGESRAAYLPTLVASGSHLRDKTMYPDSIFGTTAINSLTGNISLSWRLFDFGGRRANLRASELLLQAALANHDAVLQKTLSAVISAYSEVQITQENWQTREKNEALSREILATTERRETLGAGARTDTLQAKTALAKAGLEKNRAKSAYDKARAVLVFTLGLPATSDLTLSDDTTSPVNTIRQDLKQWLEQTQQSHPAIVAARAQLEAARQKLIVTRSEGSPTIDFSGNYYENGRPNQGVTSTRTKETIVGVSVTIPLFNGFAQTYKVRGAQAQLEQKEFELQDTEHQVLTEVVKAHAEATAALNNLEASQLLLSTAEEALDSVKRKFDKGAANLLDMLNTQAALLDAQHERIRCFAEWRSARLILLANSGALGRGAIGGK